jgi:ligand-binding SRPBCC domain-containing protein
MVRAMKIIIKTPINKDYRTVFSLFDVKLFTALKPPLTSLKITRFDGCKKGDEVHLVVNGQRWVSHITDFVENADEIYFVDLGANIPFPLKSWKHIHRIERSGANTCNVIDDIEYSTGNIITDKIIYPALKFMFMLRGPVYKRELN